MTMEHPDITHALRTGYPSRVYDQEDTPEMREEYISNDYEDFYKWVRRFHADLVDEYIEDNESEYLSWLN